MKDFFNKEVRCPICGNCFEVWKVRTTAIQVEKQDTDFCIHYRKVNPMIYSIWVCNNCLYAGEEQDFDAAPRIKEDKLKKHILGLFRKYQMPNLSGERTDEVAMISYRIAIDWLEILQRSSFRLGSFFLRMAWLNRGKDEEKERELLEKAVEYYRKGFERESEMPKNLGEVGVAYLIGELYRRLDMNNEAVKWFSRVLTHPELHSYPNVERLCRDQWQESKDKAKAELEEIVEQG